METRRIVDLPDENVENIESLVDNFLVHAETLQVSNIDAFLASMVLITMYFVRENESEENFEYRLNETMASIELNLRKLRKKYEASD